MFTSLQASERADLLVIGGILASLAFSREHSSDLEWLHGRLREMHDVLRESPFLQEILQEGRQEGKLEALRDLLLAIMQARFPQMARLTEKLAALIDDPADLKEVIVRISMAQTDEEVQQYLLEGIEKSGN